MPFREPIDPVKAGIKKKNLRLPQNKQMLRAKNAHASIILFLTHFICDATMYSELLLKLITLAVTAGLQIIINSQEFE